MKFILAILGLAIFFATNTFASPAIQEGQVLVRLSEGASVGELNEIPGVSDVVPLVQDLKIYLVKLEGAVMSARESLKNFRSHRAVSWAQLDHFIANRGAPNDRDFGKQWNLYNAKNKADIRALEAWNTTTGGTDKNGNDIVVAIVDGGVDISHEDLSENIWVNTKEVPSNKIDDDGNGYIDDINGWSAVSDSPQMKADDHATHIAGIIGAKGNNHVMVTGINWNVKIMSVDQAGSTSTVVKAYGYVLKNKKLWLETKGERGANVVSTNSSFGIDYGDCTKGSYPAWNDMYNEMGKVGILSAAATANLAVDVDQKGDVPTGCNSPYLIAVTNTTDTDRKNDSAAYGKINVDLGAPGTEVFSTITNNGTAKKTGTSMATPHVAGAVALIHAAASVEFNNYYLGNPAEAVLKIKEMILTSVDPIPDLKNRSLSGGRLNLAHAVQLASEFHQNHN